MFENIATLAQGNQRDFEGSLLINSQKEILLNIYVLVKIHIYKTV